MRFISDNAAAAHPKVIEAIVASNRLDAPYDEDEWSKRLDAAFSDLFETQVRAFWVTTGTAANCLALAALCPPYRGIICHKDAHIEVDEAGAPGFFTGGAKLILLDGVGAKIAPETVAAACDRIRPDVHQVQPAAISITNATEYGLVYRAGEVAALGQLAKERGWPSIWMERASPTRSPARVRARRTSPGARASTLSASASSRTAVSMPRP